MIFTWKIKLIQFEIKYTVAFILNEKTMQDQPKLK